MFLEKFQKCIAFGKPHLSKAYYVTPLLWHVVIIVWKHECSLLVAQDLAIILRTCGVKMLCKLKKLVRLIDFSVLQVLPLDWNHEEEDEGMVRWIVHPKWIANNACLLHYNMGTTAVERLCGGRWTTERCWALEMMEVISRILPDEMFWGWELVYLRVFLTACTASWPTRKWWPA